MGVRPGDIVVVFGGGFVGRALVVALHVRGYRIRLVTRRPDRHPDLLVIPDLELWEGDVGDDLFVAKVLAGAAALVNLIGILSERGPGDFVRLHEELPARLGRLGRSLRLVHVSAAGAYPDSPSAYLRSKARGELSLRAQSPASVIVRPAIIYGPRDHFVCRFLTLLRFAPLGLPLPCAESRQAPVHRDDVVAGLVAALGRVDAVGQTYEFCGPDVMSLGEIVGLIAQGRRRLFPLTPASSLFLARIAEYLPSAPLTVDQVRSLQAGGVSKPGSPDLTALLVHPRGFKEGLASILSEGPAC